MLEKLKNILPELEYQNLRLETLFFTRSDISKEDIQRETIPLSLYLPIHKRSLLQENLPHEFLENESGTASESEEYTIQRIKLPLQIFFKTTEQIKPDHVVLKFIERPFKFHYQLGEDYIHINTADIITILQTAHLLSRWPFLRVDNSKIVLEEIKRCIASISYSQKRYFFNRILLGRRPSAGLLFLEKIGLLKEFIPELTAGKNLSQNRYHAYDIFEHSIRALDGVQKADLMIRWSALLHDIGKVPTRVEKVNGEATFHNHEMLSAKMVVPIMKRIGIPKNIGQRVRFLVRNHMFHYTKEWSDKAIKRFLRKIGSKNLEDLILLRLADRKGSGKKAAFPKGLQMLIEHIERVREGENKLKVKDLEISGYDLMELGIEPGPTMGRVLNTLLGEVENGDVPNKKEILKEKASKYLKLFI